MAKNFTEHILGKLNSYLSAVNRPTITTKNLVFVLDDKIEYGAKSVVSNSSLIEPEQIERVIEPFLSKGPSWIHANLISIEDLSIITLKFGGLVGNPNPSLNVSYEPNLKLEIGNFKNSTDF